MHFRRDALTAVIGALMGALALNIQSIAAQPAKTVTITLTIEGMT